jgi:hypothetical protein
MLDSPSFNMQMMDYTFENDRQGAKNMKLLLCAFEQLSGLKINFHKSELFYYGAA